MESTAIGETECLEGSGSESDWTDRQTDTWEALIGRVGLGMGGPVGWDRIWVVSCKIRSFPDSLQRCLLWVVHSFRRGWDGESATVGCVRVWSSVVHVDVRRGRGRGRGSDGGTRDLQQLR